jgi:hypothetical protein
LGIECGAFRGGHQRSVQICSSRENMGDLTSDPSSSGGFLAAPLPSQAGRFVRKPGTLGNGIVGNRRDPAEANVGWKDAGNSLSAGGLQAITML